MNDRKETKRYGRGIAPLVVITFLFGTLVPLFGGTAQASETDDLASDNCTGSIIVEPSTNLTSADSGDISPFGIGAGNVYGLVKYVDANAAGKKTDDAGELMLSPLRDARVRIFNVNPSGADVDITYDYTTIPPTEMQLYSGDDGYFYFNINPQQWFYSDQYYAVIYSESHYANVKDSSQHTNRSDVKTFSNTDLLAGGCEFTFIGGYPDHPAWNILDSVTEAAEWVKARTGEWTRPKIDVYYPRVVDFSHYNPDDSIELTAIDGWWDNTIYHEYGHAVMAYLYNWNYPASVDNHALTKETTFECAVCEGWANYLANAVGDGSNGAWDYTLTKGNGELEYGEGGNVIINPYTPSYRNLFHFGDAFEYIDNNANGIIDYDMTEGNFAGILWDIFDSDLSNDHFFPIDWSGNTYNSYDDDGLALGFGPIWNVMASKQPFTIYEFWDGWFQYSGHASTNNDKHWIKAIYYNHGVKVDSKGFPETAPVLTDFQITSSNPHKGPWIDYKLKLSDDTEDMDFLRVRLEYYSNTAGKWVKFHEVTNDVMPIVGGFYTYNVHVNALGDGTWTVRAVVDDDMLETISSNNVNIVVDTTKPISSITPSAPYWRNTSPMTITATASNGLSGVKDVKLYYSFSPNAVTWTSWSQFGSADAVTPYQWSFTWPNGQGHYQLYSIATDNAGNVEAATGGDVAYGYDITPPQSTPVLISPISFTVTTTLTHNFMWSTVDDSVNQINYQLIIDDSLDFNTPLYNVPASTNEILLGLDYGTWYWKVRAVDAAGNIGPYSNYNVLTTTLPEPIEPELRPSISGKVLDAHTTTGIPGASVILINTPTSEPPDTPTISSSIGENIISAVTDSQGCYAIYGIDPGTRWFRASASGYVSMDASDVIPLSGGAVLVFALQPVSSPVTPIDQDLPTCIVEGTMISTPSGTMLIEKIKKGDDVLTFNEQTGIVEPNLVLATYAHTSSGYLQINDLKLTENHPIYINGNFMLAGEARLGDILMTINGPVKISSIQYMQESVSVFNLEVGGNHNYYANGYLVHNKLPQPLPGGCPFVYIWNGTTYVEDNNLLPTSTDTLRADLDVVDYYQLNNSIQIKNGTYAVAIIEDMTEHSYLDCLDLLVVDYPENCNVGTDSNGEIYTYSETITPASCVDEQEISRMNRIQYIDDYFYTGEPNEYLLLTFDNIPSDTMVAKLVVTHKMIQPTPENYYWDPENPLNWKCSIHIQIRDIAGEWTGIDSIPARVNWATNVVDLSNVVDYLHEGRQLRLFITGIHYIDFIGLDISETENVTITSLSPIYANYLGYKQYDFTSRIIETDECYLQIQPEEGIEVSFPYIPLTAQYRDLILVANGHYYTENFITVSQPVWIMGSIVGGNSGNVTISLEEKSDILSVRDGQIVDLQHRADIFLDFRQNPEIYYSLNIEFSDCDEDVSVLLEIISLRGRETIEFNYHPETGNTIQWQSIDDILKNTTGVYFDQYSGTIQVFRNTLIRFSYNEKYINLANWTNVSWNFGDGTQTTDLKPTHVFDSDGLYRVNVTLGNNTGLFYNLATWMNIDVQSFKPEPIIGIYQEVELELNIAGRKGNAVCLRVFEDDQLIDSMVIYRAPKNPYAQSTFMTINKYIGREYTLVLVYDATYEGDNPTWVHMKTAMGEETFFYAFSTDYGFNQEIVLNTNFLESITQDVQICAPSIVNVVNETVYSTTDTNIYSLYLDHNNIIGCRLYALIDEIGWILLEKNVDYVLDYETGEIEILFINYSEPGWELYAFYDYYSYPPVNSTGEPLDSHELVFDGSGSHDLDGEIVSYVWDFGDGMTSVGMYAEHTYFESGIYKVTLTVLDDDGRYASEIFVISLT